MPRYLCRGISLTVSPSTFPFMIRKPAKILYLLSLLLLASLAESQHGPVLKPGNMTVSTIIEQNLTFTAAHAQGELVVYSPSIIDGSIAFPTEGTMDKLQP